MILLHEAEPASARVDVPRAAPPGDDVFVFPTTVGQQGFWYLDQLQPGNPAYNIAVRFRLQGPLRVEPLEQALNEVVRRHEALRTTFIAQDGVPVQVVSPRLFLPLRRDDLREGPAEQRALALAAEEARQPFDLARGPLFRARLLRLDDELHVLLLTVHHIIADGWSTGVITRELAVLYEAFCQGNATPLVALPLQYGDFAVWQKEWLATGCAEDQLRYWVRRLAGLRVVDFPADRRKPAVRTSGGAIESVLLPRSLTAALTALSHQHGATLFMTCLAGLKLLLRRYCFENDFTLGASFAGRCRAELEPLVGLFINSLVLRTDLSGDPTFLELLARVRETVTDALANQDVPFEQVVQAAQPRRAAGHHPLYRINFIFQRAFLQPLRMGDVSLTPIPALSPGAIYDLNFFMVERDEGWRASCEYSTDLYDPDSIRRLLGQFQSVLEEVVADPSRRISTALSRAPAPPAGVVEAQATATPRGAAADALEARVADVWRKLLGKDTVDPTADFFDEGGHSLLAARLLAQIERAFGKRLTLASFFEAPTIRAVAARLRDRPATGRGGQLFALQPEGARPPLILLDAGPFLRPLVRRLGRDRPVLGLSFPAVSALPDPFTVDDVAARLADTLRNAQVKGPYHLAGWSGAGVVAYELARQLRARGEEVGLLVLFDTNNPAYLRRFRGWRALPRRAYLYLQRALYQFRKLVSSSPGEGLKQFWARLFPPRTKPLVRLAELAQQPAGEESLQDYAESLERLYRAVPEYDPKPYAGPSVLFRSEVLQKGWFRDPLLGWGPFALGGLRVKELPGEHDSMFHEPVVDQLAAVLTECLDTSERGQ